MRRVIKYNILLVKFNTGVILKYL